MADLQGLKARLLQLLGDGGEARYTAALLEESLRQALAAYGQVLPQVLEEPFSLEAEGREHALALGSAPLFVVRLVHPAQEPWQEVPFQFFVRGGQPVLVIGGGSLPQAGESYRLRYAAAHTLEGLDGAEVTSLPPANESLLIRGAAGYATLLRLAGMAPAYGGRVSEGEALSRLGQQWLGDFQQALERLRRSEAMLHRPTGLRLDRWGSFE
jgi:hypothetical protein